MFGCTASVYNEAAAFKRSKGLNICRLKTKTERTNTTEVFSRFSLVFSPSSFNLRRLPTTRLLLCTAGWWQRRLKWSWTPEEQSGSEGGGGRSREESLCVGLPCWQQRWCQKQKERERGEGFRDDRTWRQSVHRERVGDRQRVCLWKWVRDRFL